MGAFYENMLEYKKQLEKGLIQEAYRGLMEYLLGLKTYFKDKYPDYFVSGSLYFGYMDMTYFSFIPASLKQRQLRIAVVFLHREFRFEVWLAGYNKQVQAKYWKLIKDRGWDKYRLVPTLQGADSILEHVLVQDPDFSELFTLTGRIEASTLEFIQDVEGFLDKHGN
jgi:hypothetical protein